MISFLVACTKTGKSTWKKPDALKSDLEKLMGMQTSWKVGFLFTLRPTLVRQLLILFLTYIYICIQGVRNARREALLVQQGDESKRLDLPTRGPSVKR